MNPDSKIYVAGHGGLAGSAILRCLRSRGFNNLITRAHSDLDLTDQAATRKFFEGERPEYVFLAAGKVGGILANNTYRAEFIQQNLAIQANVIHESYRVGVRRLLALGSSCIYPRDCVQPIREKYLLTGPLEPTNQPYAIAKIAAIEMCWSYNRQYGTRYICAMPTNLYGPGDNYDLGSSHVLPALLRKFHEAKVSGRGSTTVWGTGAPRREFLYSDDLADACHFLITLPEEQLRLIISEHEPPLVNVGCGQDISILDLAALIGATVGAGTKVDWDRSKPDGTPRKLLDVSRIASLGWSARTTLEAGLLLAYEDFLARDRV